MIVEVSLKKLREKCLDLRDKEMMSAILAIQRAGCMNNNAVFRRNERGDKLSVRLGDDSLEHLPNGAVMMIFKVFEMKISSYSADVRVIRQMAEAIIEEAFRHLRWLDCPKMGECCKIFVEQFGLKHIGFSCEFCH